MRQKKEINLNEIMNKIDNVDLVNVVPQERKISNGEIVGGNILVESDNQGMIGTYNRDKEKLLSVFQEDYHLVDHREMIAKISDFFGKHVRGNYWMKDDCSRLYVYIYPEEMKQLIEHPETGEKDWIDFGIRFANSYDGSNALKVSSIAYRQVCSNGMWAQTFKRRGYQRHTKNSSIQEFAESIEAVIEADYDDVLMTYQESMTEKVPKVDVLLENVWENKNQALKKFIMEKVSSTNDVSKWDVYCKATEGLTHGFRVVHGELKTAEKYTEETLKNLHKNANRILSVDLDKIDWDKDVEIAGEK